MPLAPHWPRQLPRALAQGSEAVLVGDTVLLWDRPPLSAAQNVAALLGHAPLTSKAFTETVGTQVPLTGAPVSEPIPESSVIL